MWITLRDAKFALLNRVNGEQVQLRQGQPYDVSDEDWAAQPLDFQAMFSTPYSGGGGEGGSPGAPGASAYQLAVQGGFQGTQAQWLASLKGDPGQDGAPGQDGNDGAPGQDGAPGANGKSAYEIAVENGFAGTEAEFAMTLLAGQEIDYKFKDTTETTTNTNTANTPLLANKIPGLSITVVGNGRPVEIEFWAYVVHSVVNGSVGAHILETVVDAQNNVLVPAVGVGIGSPPTNTVTRPQGLSVRTRRLIPVGERRVYEVGKFIFGAGTGTYDAAVPMWLAATQK